MARDWTPSDAADAADDDAHRQWWRKPDPFDPANQDQPEDED